MESYQSNNGPGMVEDKDNDHQTRLVSIFKHSHLMCVMLRTNRKERKKKVVKNNFCVERKTGQSR